MYLFDRNLDETHLFGNNPIVQAYVKYWVVIFVLWIGFAWT